MPEPMNYLQQVFNFCAGKVVALEDLEHYQQEKLRDTLSKQDMQAYQEMHSLDASSVLSDRSAVSQLSREIGDGSAGVYYESGHPEDLYLHVKLLEYINRGETPETELTKKLSIALAEAIFKSPDYRQDVKAGRLVPFPL